MAWLASSLSPPGVNLAQGVADFPLPEELRAATLSAMQSGISSSSIPWGMAETRAAVAQTFARFGGVPVDPETEVTICASTQEAMVATFLALLDPGDEVVLFEPYHEDYWASLSLAGAKPVFVKLSAPGFAIDWPLLERTITPRSRAIVVNTPNNPTGKVFTGDELSKIAKICEQRDIVAVTDESYEHILFDGAEHVSLATLQGMRERTIVLNSLLRTYNTTGLSYAIAPPEITTAIRKTRSSISLGASAVVQTVATVALSLPDRYYATLRREYQERRDVLLAGLQRAGLTPLRPKGACYVMASFERLGFKGNDQELARHLIERTGVASVPGSCFFSKAKDGSAHVRFCFPKKLETLREGVERLGRLASPPLA
jgi:aminotransferase